MYIFSIYHSRPYEEFRLFLWIEIPAQILTTYTNLFRFCFLRIATPVLAPNVWANENPKVDTRFRELNSAPHDCEAEALPHDHGHRKKVQNQKSSTKSSQAVMGQKSLHTHQTLF